MDGLPASSARVQAALDAAGLTVQVVTMPATTRTAEEAASAIGCTVAQIAKSLVFRGAATGKPVLVIASGVNRVNEKTLSGRAGEKLEKAAADFVRDTTGYAIGGVPPVGFPRPIETWIDEDLLRFEHVWAAGGTPFAVFRIESARLAALTGGTVTAVTSKRDG